MSQEPDKEMFIHTPFGLSGPADRSPQFHNFDVVLPEWIDPGVTEQRSHLKYFPACILIRLASHLIYCAYICICVLIYTRAHTRTYIHVSL
jgi:hypothetical protein